MSRQDVAALTVRLGEYNIKQSGETEIFESKAARVVRHKDFTQQTLVSIPRVMSRVYVSVTPPRGSTRTWPSSRCLTRSPRWTTCAQCACPAPAAGQ